MKRFLPRITYANVVATMALFLALAGGTVWAANKINGKQIKKNTIPGNRIKKNTLTANQIKRQTITNNQIKPGSIQRTSLAAGSVPGVIIAEASATNLPGATTQTPPGPTPFALVGTPTFTAVPGKAYNLTGELVGNPVANSTEFCEPGVQIYVNGVPIFFLELFAGDRGPGFDSRFPQASFTASLLTESGPQSITTKVFGDNGCEPNTTLERLRIIVTEVG
jgi:hypothetical protein